MKASRLTQKIHKWLGLLVGIQLLVWTVSGFYMVVVDIDIIHGDHLVKSSHSVTDKSLNLDQAISFSDVLQANPSANSISMTWLLGKQVYRVESVAGTILIDPLNGDALPPVDEPLARRLALSYYAGKANVIDATLISENPPGEIGARPLPLWRIDFDDIWGTSFYITPKTGELATRRHTLWRVFDFVWMLHIMDYDEREDVNNLLLRIVSALALLLVLSGFYYLYFRLNSKGQAHKAEL